MPQTMIKFAIIALIACNMGCKERQNSVSESKGERVYKGHNESEDKIKEYDIWSENCHSAANAFCRSDIYKMDKRGILKCRGNPKRSPANHTANWEVLPGKTCIYNWGEECCWKSTKNPPDVSSGEGKGCAKWACDDQYSWLQTDVYKAGELVEEPGENTCVREQYRKNGESWFDRRFNYSQCNSCCTRRANYWKPAKWGFDKKLNFIRGCKKQCSISIGKGGKYKGSSYSLGYQAGLMCADETSFFSRSSYKQQCRNCCTKFKDSTLFPRIEMNDCRKACDDRF